MKTIGKSFREHYIIWTILVAVLCFALLRLRKLLPFGNLVNYAVIEIIVAAIVLFLLYCINGKGALEFSNKGFKYALKLGWFPILFAILAMFLGIFSAIYEGLPLQGNPVVIILEILILTIFVGLFEETLFRGFLLSSFLKTRGDSIKGIKFSCIISSIIFGFMHVYTDVFDFIADPSTFSSMALLQVFGKIITAGMFGFILAVIYIQNHNLWSVAILHTINDFAVFVPTFLYTSEGITGNYVDTTGSMTAIAGMASYVLQFLFTLPVLIYAYRQIKYINLPQPGLFVQEWYPEIVINKKKAH